MPSVSVPAQVQPYPHHHQSQGRVNRQNNDDGGNGTTGGASGELVPYTPPQQSDENDGGWSDEKASKLQQDMVLALEEQEKLSSAPTPSSPYPQCHSVELLRSQIPERDQSGTGLVRSEELRYASPLRTRDQGEEVQAQPEQEVAAEDGRGSNGEPQPEERGGKRSYREMNGQTRSQCVK